MLKRTLIASAIAATTLVSSGAYAQTYNDPVGANGFSYTYGQLGYDYWDYDHGPDASVLYGQGAFELDQHLFLRGNVGFYDGDYDRHGYGSVDGHRLSAGLGYHTALQRRLDLVGTADLIRDDNDAHDHEWGYRLRAGLRHQTTDRLQLSGGAIYENIYDGNFGVYGQGLVSLTSAVDVGVRGTLQDDSDTVGLFGRYNF